MPPVSGTADPTPSGADPGRSARGRGVGPAMRAIGVTEFGGPENLQVLDLPEPHAGPGEVRIRVHAATVNPTDSGLRSGRYAARHADQPGPFIPGADAAGRRRRGR